MILARALPIGNGRLLRIKILKGLLAKSINLKLNDYKDRLASFFHWGDAQGLEQALLVAEDHSIDLQDLKRWAKKEGFEKKLDDFLRKHRKSSKK